jgi:hypothetical protein
MSDREPSSDLLRGRRALDGVPELRLREDYAWDPKADPRGGRWLLRVEVRLDVSSPHLPPTSQWVVLLEDDYPLGSVKVHPAREGGIVATFPHQARNLSCGEERPWRTGAPCLDSSLAPLGTIAGETEPDDADRRLRWCAERLVTWCRRAATGTLQAADDPFELPALPVPPPEAARVAFQEDGASFDEWRGVAHARSGTFDWSRIDNWIVVRRFVGADGAMVGSGKWGSWLPEKAIVHKGAWLQIPNFPVAPPWGAPSTWGDLRAAMRDVGADLDAHLQRALRVVRHEPEALLLIGHPMPAKVGAPMVEMNWVAIDVRCWNEETPRKGRPRGGHRHRPRTSPPPGVRNGTRSLWAYDRVTSFRDAQPIVWRASENLAEHRLRARGRFGSGLTSGRILLVGGGALGSLLAEYLVRGGAQLLEIYDGENFDAGNLSRHTLTLADVDQPKVSGLAKRLASLSPSLRITDVADTLRGNRKLFSLGLRSADIVIDCTGSDAALSTLAAMGPQQDTKDWYSVSLGLCGRRLFFFHARSDRFPASLFHEFLETWLPSEAKAISEAALPREGIGCWHPLFPARIDQVAVAAATAVRLLHESTSRLGDVLPTLTVFEERSTPDGQFTGLVRVGSPE